MKHYIATLALLFTLATPVYAESIFITLLRESMVQAKTVAYKALAGLEKSNNHAIKRNKHLEDIVEELRKLTREL